MTRVLVVDDEAPIRRTMRANLEARGYVVDLAATGEEGLQLAIRHHPDVVLLDLGLPGIDGLEVIDSLRSWSQVPIVVLSARGSERDKVDALDAGADDYVSKPFGMDELLARLRAALRRGTVPDEHPTIVTPDFTIDFAAKLVLDRSGQPLRLTRTEWALLEILGRTPDRLITHRQLLTEIWGPSYSDASSYLRVHMAHLRRKLEPDRTRPRYLLTEAGMGYRFNLRTTAEASPAGAADTDR
jgi:two-component system KDP operon response regulator KdpE